MELATRRRDPVWKVAIITEVDRILVHPRSLDAKREAATKSALLLSNARAKENPKSRSRMPHAALRFSARARAFDMRTASFPLAIWSSAHASPVAVKSAWFLVSSRPILGLKNGTRRCLK